MLTTIATKLFSKCGDNASYKAYLTIKYQVFVVELDWSSLKDKDGAAIAKEDPFDEDGRFSLAITGERVPIGIVRAIPLQKGFPYRELFKQHLDHIDFSSLLDSLCMFNALAVLPAYRGKKYWLSEQGWIGSAGRLLMLGLIRYMEQQGMKGAIVTTSAIVSARLCHGLGFYIIDSPTITSLRPEPLLNMGMVFGSEAHIRAQAECGMKPRVFNPIATDSLTLLHYFESCQQQVLGSRRLESLF
jgi:N-acyl-L-homoserine lactone synthetase